MSRPYTVHTHYEERAPGEWFRCDLRPTKGWRYQRVRFRNIPRWGVKVIPLGITRRGRT